MMEMNFKFWNGKKVEDVGGYLRNFLKDNPTYRIYVGCDSADKDGGKIKYVVAICLYSEMLQKGSHIIYAYENIMIDEHSSKDEDQAIIKRLQGEIYRAYEVGEFLEGEMRDFCSVRWPEVTKDRKLSIVHLDVNQEAGRKVRKKYRQNTSNKVMGEAIGTMRGSGYTVELKPDSWAASRAADRLVG